MDISCYQYLKDKFNSSFNVDPISQLFLNTRSEIGSIHSIVDPIFLKHLLHPPSLLFSLSLFSLSLLFYPSITLSPLLLPLPLKFSLLLPPLFSLSSSLPLSLLLNSRFPLLPFPLFSLATRWGINGEKEETRGLWRASRGRKK